MNQQDNRTVWWKSVSLLLFLWCLLLNSCITASADAGDILQKQPDTKTEEEYFTSQAIKRNDAVYRRIHEKTYPDNDDIALEDLRYLQILHFNFDHKIQIGELIVNQEIAEDVLSIFKELYDEEYELESVLLPDEYWTGDSESTDTASMEANNSSAFSYRVIPDSGNLSKHAAGYAIDINPLQNPYVCDEICDPPGGAVYADRSVLLPHMISEDDLCCQIFKKYGFTWGGDWNRPKDYQHFEKRDSKAK